jgi:uncharacterized protein (TIGR00251 family)
MTCPLKIRNDQTVLSVKVTPRASANQVTGYDVDLFGELTLKVTVTAIPDQGEANAAVIQLLSKTFSLAKSRIHLWQGTTNRLKVFLIEEKPEALWDVIQRSSEPR